MTLHCPHCIATEMPLPMPRRRALRFGIAHARSIADQSLRGIVRTLPVWALPGLFVYRGVQGFRRPGEPITLGKGAVGAALTAGGLQVLWTGSFAAVSGFRTALRLTTLTSANMIPIVISCHAGGPGVIACAHRAPLGSTWYVDGVFAWPRHHGGGGIIVRYLLDWADGEQVALTLTALSPRVAASYRSVGFRNRLWIYFMCREPTPGQ